MAWVFGADLCPSCKSNPGCISLQKYFSCVQEDSKHYLDTKYSSAACAFLPLLCNEANVSHTFLSFKNQCKHSGVPGNRSTAVSSSNSILAPKQQLTEHSGQRAHNSLQNPKADSEVTASQVKGAKLEIQGVQSHSWLSGPFSIWYQDLH